MISENPSPRTASAAFILALSALALGACQKKAQPQEQNIAMDQATPDNATLANADIEMLPPDESSGTSSKELENGTDNPDVTDLNAANSN